MDRIEQLLKEIREDKRIWQDERGRPIRFTRLAETVADIFEQYGFGDTIVYLAKREDRAEADQAKALRRVIDKFKKYPEIVSNRARGRYIIKALDSLHRLEV